MGVATQYRLVPSLAPNGCPVVTNLQRFVSPPRCIGAGMAVFQGVQGGPAMTEKTARIVIVAAFILPIAAMAQGGSTTTPSTPLVLPTKIGTISIQSAIVATNDGQRDLQVLE